MIGDRARNGRVVQALATLALCTAVASAQTLITPPPNKYAPEEDVKLGERAAAQVEQQMPILHDDFVTSYVETIGRRLVAAIPPELQHPEFTYTFQVVNVKEINAFALPGGPMFVNRGMIEAARDEGEIAGVMAHELSHVILRHGTAQQSKASKYAIGQMAGAVLGAILGGGLGQVVAEGTQFGLGTAFLRFSREDEKQADLEGTHLMARAGYDPRDMANVFKTIEEQGGPGGPQWLSDHPNPGNRYGYILQEAQSLQVVNPVHDTREFDRVRAHLKTLASAPSTETATRDAAAAPSVATPPAGRVEPPSSRYVSYTEGGIFEVSAPANWRERPGSNSVTFAPDGAYDRGAFTSGIQFGVARNETHDLQTATDELIASLARSNPNLGRPFRYQPATIGGRDGLQATVTNPADSGSEAVTVFTTLLPDRNLFYAIGVAPAKVDYGDTFRRIIASLRFTG